MRIFQYILIIPFFLLFHLTGINAQFMEVGGFGGVASYIGDVNEGVFLPNTQVMFGGFICYNFHPNFSAKAIFLKGTLQARDRNSGKPHIRERNLSFKSDLMEMGFQFDFNIFSFAPDNSGRVFSPYLFTGASLILFQPTTVYEGETIYLQQVGTEGQGLEGFAEKYKLFSFAFPVGIGIKYAISNRINIGLEIGYRFTLTDYIDDVSTVFVAPQVLQQNGELAVALSNRTEEYTGISANDLIGQRRGNSNNNDGYIVWGLRISFNLHGKYAFKPKKRPYKITKWF